MTECAAACVGIAKAAYELFLERVVNRPITCTSWEDQREHPLTQIQVATAANKITAAGWDGLMAYMPQGGMLALLQKIMADAKADLLLNSPVKSVTQELNGVRVVTASGTSYTAPVAVVAIPTNMWRTISFSPGLPSVHAAATNEGLAVVNSTKLWLRLRPDMGKVIATGAEGQGLSLMLPQKQLSNGDILAVAFSENASLNTASLVSVQGATAQIAPGVQVVEHVAQPWGSDPYSMGGWGMRRPNRLLAQYPAIQQPSGRVVFATGDISTGWNGAFIDGAIESGTTAAQQALNMF
ncbi:MULTISPECIES: FAD-dependent oxidoreductase [Actinosynnema]|uniref:FAD-dependent oxidoreductase n=1 Tax=Actinosynnema TaxID=40566 RepID=UPI0020A52921|nr:FAD-dependent oxidoreductase [Actinosynnema pretiosum]MCP2097725.1 Acyl-CoA dehydrogenase, C-terminal domain [Actinosynnema pretiosum]